MSKDIYNITCPIFWFYSVMLRGESIFLYFEPGLICDYTEVTLWLLRIVIKGSEVSTSSCLEHSRWNSDLMWEQFCFPELNMLWGSASWPMWRDPMEKLNLCDERHGVAVPTCCSSFLSYQNHRRRQNHLAELFPNVPISWFPMAQQREKHLTGWFLRNR